MTDRLVKLTIHPERMEDFINEFNRVRHMIRNFNGCRRLELLSVSALPGVVFTYSQWDSELSLNSYLQSELFRTTWQQVKPLFSARAEAWTLEKLQDVDQ